MCSTKRAPHSLHKNALLSLRQQVSCQRNSRPSFEETISTVWKDKFLSSSSIFCHQTKLSGVSHNAINLTQVNLNYEWNT